MLQWILKRSYTSTIYGRLTDLTSFLVSDYTSFVSGFLVLFVLLSMAIRMLGYADNAIF